MRLACLIAPLLVTPLIHASPPMDPATMTLTETYRARTLLADAGAVSVLLVGVSSESSELMTFGLVSYAVGAAFVHAAHRNGPSFVASIGMRIGLPLIAGMIGDAAEPECPFQDPIECADNDSGGDRALLGVAIGAVSAMILDHTFLATHTVTRPRRILTPTWTATHGGLSLGLTGTF